MEITLETSTIAVLPVNSNFTLPFGVFVVLLEFKKPLLLKSIIGKSLRKIMECLRLNSKGFNLTHEAHAEYEVTFKSEKTGSATGRNTLPGIFQARILVNSAGPGAPEPADSHTAPLTQALYLKTPTRRPTELLARFQAEHRKVQGTGDAFALLIDHPVLQPSCAVWAGMRHFKVLVVDDDSERAWAIEFRWLVQSFAPY